MCRRGERGPVELAVDLLPAGPWRNNHKNVSALVFPTSHHRPALSQPCMLLPSFSLWLLLSLLSLWVRNWGPPGSPTGCLERNKREEKGHLHIFGPDVIKSCSDAEGPLQEMGCTTSHQAQARIINLR